MRNEIMLDRRDGRLYFFLQKSIRMHSSFCSVIFHCLSKHVSTWKTRSRNQHGKNDWVTTEGILKRERRKKKDLRSNFKCRNGSFFHLVSPKFEGRTEKLSMKASSTRGFSLSRDSWGLFNLFPLAVLFHLPQAFTNLNPV